MAFEANPVYLMMAGIDEALLSRLEQDWINYESKASDINEYDKMREKGWRKALDMLREKLVEDRAASGLSEEDYNVKRKEIMKEANPRFILRNHLIDKGIKKAENNDFSEVSKLLEASLLPWEFHDEDHTYFSPPRSLKMCTKLSCSS